MNVDNDFDKKFDDFFNKSSKSNTPEKDYNDFLKYIDKKGDIDLKKMYGINIIRVLIGWELFVICFSLIQICCPYSYKISDTVFIALLTSATANILILPKIVLNYLFSKEK
ncbi:hypothetical protein EZS27_030836 [termite gut metagenome]|uniref:Uncharacterized protein n=1 Tax=termite gut metagenome TaxID=433724 RepID=A0A5J4QC51_9ZZZZ